MARGETYAEFVEKFQPKRTTDDCITPDEIYNIVKDWVIKEYNLENAKIIRPFWPNEDYTKYDYSGNCVVIDNPPFSILAQIKRFYNERGIRFFLFAPALTMFSGYDDKTNYVIVNHCIRYENGAKVCTSFVTNMGEAFIRTAPLLKSKFRSIKKPKDNIAKYKYNKNVFTFGKSIIVDEFDFRIQRNECVYVKRLDQQALIKKGIYGGGFIVSDKIAKQLDSITELKRKRLSVIREQKEKEKENEKIIINLSDRETEIVNQLNAQ